MFQALFPGIMVQGPIDLLMLMQQKAQQQRIAYIFQRQQASTIVNTTFNDNDNDVDGTIIFTQLAPAAVWTINHNTGQFPSVTTVDSAGNEVQGAVQYISSNQVTITFSSPFAGRAFLNV
jgi:hypothetical protein